ncbi:hypothetical protein PsorP6_015290 [Peronosclerospora sorghi]|uniref:Uncharacterized protein n=1 Tax=Peronosclerospora sorghi TaxID=230839 RepID=A0ACC0VRY4_9STRA|nr:hypothetical protein PsorP6_015290 [Peronosclerospora sorghi]
MRELSDQRIDNVNAARAQFLLVVVTVKRFISGLIGSCEYFVGYPLETVPARMQTLQRKERTFIGPLDWFTKIVQDGGLICLLKSAVWKSGLCSHSCRDSTVLTEGMLYTPFEVIKVKIQTLIEVRVDRRQEAIGSASKMCSVKVG